MSKEGEVSLGRFLHMLLVFAVVAAIAALLYTLRAVLLPFLVALLLAYLIDPFVVRIQRVVKHRGSAVLITLLLLALAAMGIMSLAVPMLANEIAHFVDLLRHELPSWKLQWQSDPWAVYITHWLATLDVQRLLSSQNLMEAGRKLLPGFWQGISSVLGWLLGIVGLFATLVYLVFLLIDEQRIRDRWERYVPVAYRPGVLGLVKDLERVMNAYFRGQVKIAAVLAIVYIVGFQLVGLPLALLLGLLAGALNMVPYFGLISVLPVSLCAGVLAMDTGRHFGGIMLAVAVVYALAQALEGLVLTPRIQGKSTGLRPEVILLALSVWGSLLGLVGMILALPLTTLAIGYYRRFVLDDEGQPAGADNAAHGVVEDPT
jgi:predicted PurR-regulated permease PerM